MTLEQVLSGVARVAGLPGEAQSIEVGGIEYDSRRAGAGYLFFAFPGSRVDGRAFAYDAVKRGAIAVAGESPRPDGFDAPWIQVGHGRRALATASRNFYGAPDESLGLTGITGTNGKTTTAYLLDAILREAGKTTALVSTIEYHLAGKVIRAVNTTPESLDLYRMFASLRDAGGTHATMEVSSHALALGRVWGLRFHTAVFTNLTRDHLDFHGTMEDYFAAKRMLFEGNGAPPPKFAVINHDDEAGREIRTPAGTETWWYGIAEGAPVKACRIRSSFDGLRFDVRSPRGRFPVESSLAGRINVYNILAACCAGLGYGLSPETVAAGVARCTAVPGRFERIEVGQPFLVIVDYAHTDDALRNVIAAARALEPKRVITLFGCGGDRDRAKRPLMAKAAAENSDFVVLTSDNPRSEDPLAIMNDALVGLRKFDTPHAVEPDREKAIRAALNEARPGDIVILAGKGHETYQVLKDRTIEFDDREVARRLLQSFGYRRNGK